MREISFLSRYALLLESTVSEEKISFLSVLFTSEEAGCTYYAMIELCDASVPLLKTSANDKNLQEPSFSCALQTLDCMKSKTSFEIDFIVNNGTS